MTQSDRHQAGQDQNSLQRNRDRVDRALNHYLAPGLKPFIEGQLQEKYQVNWAKQAQKGLNRSHLDNQGKINWNDPLVLLRIMKNHWENIFKNYQKITQFERNIVGELLTVRNESAHNDFEKFNDDYYTWRALDSIARLLRAIDANNEAVKVEHLREDMLKQCQQSVVASLNWQRQFQALIEDKTEEFVGREFVFNTIDKFIANNPNGYFIIEADPGVGKSAIVAKYFQQTDCVAHFNVRSQGINRAEQFLESVCTQLIARYNLPYPSLPPDATRDGKFFAKLLQECGDIIVNSSTGEPLVIAIDGLDEVDLDSQDANANILYLPAELPKSVYFVLTRRPVKLPFTVHTPQHLFDLMQYKAKSLQDIQTYIRGATERSQLGAWIDRQGLKVEEFITQLAEKSDNNFMYLRYVLGDIERGLYQDLKIENLPQGLEAYYEDHWRRMGMMTKPLPMHKVGIISVLAQLREPVSRRKISEFSGKKAITVQKVLKEWKEFLREVQVDGETRYGLYHLSFCDFLARNEIVEAYEDDLIQKTNAKIVDNLTGGVGTTEIGKQLDSLLPEDINYALKHLPNHMVKAGRSEQLHRWLTNFDFIEAKVVALGPQVLIEDYDLAINLDVLLSEENIECLKLIQGSLRLSANILAEDNTQLVEQLLGRLMSFEVADIETLLERAKQSKNASWLRPLTPNLTPPNGPLLRTLTGHTDSVLAVAVTPDGKLVISGSDDSTVKIWNRETGKELNTFKGHTHAVRSVAVTPDGKLVISGSDDSTVKVWNLETGKKLNTFKGHTQTVRSVAVTPDGKQVISGSDDRSIKVWELETGEELFTLKGHADCVLAVAVTPDGKRLISSSGFYDQTIKVWNLETQDELLTLTGHTNSINAVAVTPDGKRIISGSSDYSIKVWNLETGEELNTLTNNTSNVVLAVAVTPDGQRAIAGYRHKTIKVWNLETGEEMSSFRGHPSLVKAVTVTPDGTHFISAFKDHTIKIWNLETRDKFLTFNGHEKSVQALAVTGNRVISGSVDKTIKVWDIENGQELFTLTGHSQPVNTVAAIEKWLISGSDDNTIKIWDLERSQEVLTITEYNKVRSVAVTPDSKWIISASLDRTVKVWNLETGENIFCFEGHTKSGETLAVTPDGKVVISGAGKIIKVWDIKTGVEILTLQGHTNQVKSVAVTPDGQRVISGSNDKTIKIWNLETGVEIFPLTDHTDSVNAVAVTQDGKRLISASNDQTLKVWDLESREIIASFTGDSALLCCAIAPDGVTIVAGDRYGWLHFLRLEG